MEDEILLRVTELRAADEERCEDIKKELLELAKSYGPSNTISLLESVKDGERLPVQWELEEVIEMLEPTKNNAKKVTEEEEDDPTNRRLRGSELELYYNDPRGIRLFKSKVDDRWVLMQLDPRTGGMLQNEISGQKAAGIVQQLMGSPYWVKRPPGMSPPMQ